METLVTSVIEKYNKDASRLMDILIEIQEQERCVSDAAVKEIAKATGISSADVKQTMSFYHFLSSTPVGQNTIYLNNSVVAMLKGAGEVAAAFEKAAGCKFGSTTSDGKIGLFETSCIGMNDQEPAAIINNVVFTNLTSAKAIDIIEGLKTGKSAEELQGSVKGDGENANALINSMVNNNIHQKGNVIFSDYTSGTSLKKVVNLSNKEVIEEVKASNIRGRGGAGFPTGMKWDFCSRYQDGVKYVFCNADEGEPGTFKDRAILTEKAELLFEGMAIAGYAIKAKEGVLYLRYEYKYLGKYLESVLAKMRADNLLGSNIAGKAGFDFDIRIQFGAGAYVCGEESALIESAEGKRGEPRDRPPFPVEKGYMQKPTIVNNVETLCAITRIIEKGADWYKQMGTAESAGTKVLSISGDCEKPGVYEINWGMTIKEMLDMVGASDVQAVQVAGPSGTLINPGSFNRTISYEDLPTGGSMIVFNSSRDLIKDVVLNFTEFFIEESCGSCVPCRAMTVLLRNKLEKIIDGHGITSDLEDLQNWSAVMKLNRCGLGQTASNPIVTSLKNFKQVYETKIQSSVEFDTGFDLEASVQASCEAAGRVPNL